MKQTNPVEAKDNFSFYSILSLCTIILFFLSIVVNSLQVALIFLMFTLMFTIKYETEVIKSKIDFTFNESMLQQEEILRKCKK